MRKFGTILGGGRGDESRRSKRMSILGGISPRPSGEGEGEKRAIRTENLEKVPINEEEKENVSTIQPPPHTAPVASVHRRAATLLDPHGRALRHYRSRDRATPRAAPRARGAGRRRLTLKINAAPWSRCNCFIFAAFFDSCRERVRPGGFGKAVFGNQHDTRWRPSVPLRSEVSMSIADHFDHAPDASFIRDYDSGTARRQFHVSLLLLAVISIAAAALGVLVSFDTPRTTTPVVAMDAGQSPVAFAGKL